MDMMLHAVVSSPAAALGSMNGAWILDKSRGCPSMRGYLETMGVTELAVEAHEKGEAEHDTIHILRFAEGNKFEIQKMSRVNDITLSLTLGQELKQELPGDRIKTTLATTDHPGQSVRIVSRMPTMNGMATVVDNKKLVRENNLLVLKQSLTIKNERSGNEHTTTRFFLPYRGEIGAPARTAKGGVVMAPTVRRTVGAGVGGDEMEEDDET